MTVRAIRVFVGASRILWAPSHKARNEKIAFGGILRNNVVIGTQNRYLLASTLINSFSSLPL